MPASRTFYKLEGPVEPMVMKHDKPLPATVLGNTSWQEEWGRKDIYSIFLDADSYFEFLGSITVMYGCWDECSTAAVTITIPFPSQS
jgi:hypothetical protein